MGAYSYYRGTPTILLEGSMNPIFRNLDYGQREALLKKLKGKHRHRRKMAIYNSIISKTALTDPMDGQITPMPYAPAEPAPNGMLDGIYPQEDRENKPISSLYYGIMETHMADDEISEEEGFSKKPAKVKSKG